MWWKSMWLNDQQNDGTCNEFFILVSHSFMWWWRTARSSLFTFCWRWCASHYDKRWMFCSWIHLEQSSNGRRIKCSHLFQCPICEFSWLYLPFRITMRFASHYVFSNWCLQPTSLHFFIFFFSVNAACHLLSCFLTMAIDYSVNSIHYGFKGAQPNF